jgi:hypothetical protein
MDDDYLVRVSPRHSVRLAEEYRVLLDQPPDHDYVVQTVMNRQANGLPLVTADIVVAGKDTRRDWLLARSYPLHFRKTYYAARLRGDPKDEYHAAEVASELLGLPAPIGHTTSEFRTCLIPGVPYARLSPFGLEPDEANLRAAQSVKLAMAAGLWRLAEEAYDKLLTLHAGGLAHGDAELHNFIVCPAPLELLPIDFEAAVFQDLVDEATWTKRCAEDLGPLFTEAMYLQCALGRQRGAFGEAAWEAARTLFKDPDRFYRAIERQADLGA